MGKVVICCAACILIVGTQAWGKTLEGRMDVQKQLDKYAPVKIEIDGKLLNAKQKKVVDELVKAAHIMDEIFLRQVYEGNVKLREKLKAQGEGDPLHQYFLINYGPYDRLGHDKPFVDGVSKRFAGATFYPVDMTKAEFESWLRNHPEDREAFESNFTVIKRKGKALVAVPYSDEYRDLLKEAAGHLKKAASLADNKSLAKYLRSRADAFLSNDYFQSDVDWVRMKGHSLEVVFGPYEVYEDKLMGLKAAFEAFITRVDPKETRRLSKVAGFIGELQKNLPVQDEYKGIGRSLESPIFVAQEIYTSGDTRAGIQTIAFNLPNDERVRKQEGSKKVLLKNVQEAKFEKILLPIARLMMRSEDVSDIGSEAFFAHTLLHEVSHGIGPGEITKDGKATTVNKALKELYSVIEECKADILGVYNNAYLIGKGLYPKDFKRVLWPTYLAGIFRSVRFGIGEAHGGGNVIQFNYLWDKGAITYDSKSGLFGINGAKIEGAIHDLAQDLLMIEAKGDYNAAKKFVKKYRLIRPELKRAIDRLKDVPVDIRPVYAYK